MRWSKLRILIISSILFTGCDQTISDFVDVQRRARPERIPATTTPTSTISSDSPMVFKISPGTLNSSTSGGPGVVRGTISATRKTLALGSDMAMTVTINRSRLVPK